MEETYYQRRIKKRIIPSYSSLTRMLSICYRIETYIYIYQFQEIIFLQMFTYRFRVCQVNKKEGEDYLLLRIPLLYSYE